MKMKIAAAFASLLTLFALIISSSACMWGLYQPQEPKALREE